MSRERKHPIAEDCRQIAVRQVPAPEERTCLRWADGAAVALVCNDDTLTIRYCWPDGDASQVTMQAVRLVADKPFFGGTRHYFSCSDCARRALILFDVRGGQFMCRHCGRLANRSQSEGAWARGLMRARKLRLYLGAEGGAGDLLPSRPKGMRRQTYQALCAEIQALETIPLEAWLSDGRGVKLNVRRSRMSASRRRWWPARNGWGEPARASR